MYWKIKPVKDWDFFSYAIRKHPDNVFEREVSTGRKVVAQFTSLSEYCGHVENDPLAFLALARKLNMSNYIHTQLSAVCPHNLKGFDSCFRSVLRGNSGELDKEKFSEARLFQAEIGPFPVNFFFVTRWFEDAGMEIKIEAETSPSDTTSILRAYSLVLCNKEPESITQFLQKIYLISFFVTNRHQLVWAKGDQIGKFVKFCEGWVTDLPRRNTFINILCNLNKSEVKKFENLLLETSEESSEEKKKRAESVDQYTSRKTFHTQRHEICVQQIPENPKKIMELGCGSGQLLKLIAKDHKEISIIGLDIKRRIGKHGYLILTTDILNPNIEQRDLFADYLIMSEVIEHLEKADRERLMELILNFYVPKKFFISVPNIEFNKFFPNCDRYRHPDHKIEYTFDDLWKEILAPLSTAYDTNMINIETKEGMTPSWIVVGEHRNPENRAYQPKLYKQIRSKFEPFLLPISMYEVKEKEISIGLSSNAVIGNGKNIFYLGPTIPPVDYDDNNPFFLEHPESAFNYYQNKGVKELWTEYKYMGSRAYILCFKTIEAANKAGFDRQLIINSRGGFSFFDDKKHKEILNTIQEEIIIGMENVTEQPDFVAMDAEIMPWVFKGERFIVNQFQIPGECVFLSRKFGKYGDVENASDYLSTLENYTKNTPVEVRIFNILGMGKVTSRGFKNVINGYFLNRFWHYVTICNFLGEIIKPVEHHHVALYDSESMDDSVTLWRDFCENKGGEGFVYKTNTIMYAENGFMIQPMVKVRGQDYLRLIYGIDYLDNEYFDQVTNRSIKKKRLMAIQQHELAINILRSFLSNKHSYARKFIAGFLGTENVNYRNLDATL